MKKTKNNGFTLIELLAVITILGILLIIAIPNVLTAVENSKKRTYISTAKKYIDGTRLMVTADEIEMDDEAATYYYSVDCIELENGGRSPFAEWDEAYVVMGFDPANLKYNYFFSGFDKAGYGLNLTEENELSLSSVKPGYTLVEKKEITGSMGKVYIANKDNNCVPELYVDSCTNPETSVVYSIKVNGVEVKSGVYNTKVTVEAPAPAAGMKFAGWELDGKIISLHQSYTFFIANSRNLIPRYVSEDTPVTLNPAITMENVIDSPVDCEKAKSNVRFVANTVDMDKYTVNEAGLIWSATSNTINLKDIEEAKTNGAKITYIKTISTSGQFSVTIKGKPKDKFVRAVLFAKLTDKETGKSTYVYSNEKKVLS